MEDIRYNSLLTFKYGPRLESAAVSMTIVTSLLAEAIAANGMLPDNGPLASGCPFHGFKYY